MNFNTFVLAITGSVLIYSCTSNSEKPELHGTWKLLSGTLIENGDTLVTDYTKNASFIKIINDTHFAFLHHDLKKDSNSVYSSGGGTYTLKKQKYTENLEYCSAREWENNSFEFEISIKNDTLIQRGIEKIENKNINRLNIEKYIRIK